MKHWLAGLVVGLGVATSASAYVTEAYLFSEWSSPSTPASAPFTFTGTKGVKLTLNSSGLAVGTNALPGAVSVGIEFSFRYRQHTGLLNDGETFSEPLADRVDAEIGRWDDVDFIDEGPIDEPLNADFGANTVLFLMQHDCALTHILIAEDAGWDPFALWWDADGDFGSGAVSLFTGFDTPTRNAILARPDFAADDSGDDIDQAYLFVFGGAGLPPGYLAIAEIGNFGAEGLEVDFAGARCIPEPGSGLLVALAVWMVAGMVRRIPSLRN
ncbi:MAG: hypothetical protein RMM51_04785 [Verrucomicrobiae bacterium]|nr:hypothetical protein [Verrucomicrobiae bacterium]